MNKQISIPAPVDGVITVEHEENSLIADTLRHFNKEPFGMQGINTITVAKPPVTKKIITQQTLQKKNQHIVPKQHWQLFDPKPAVKTDEPTAVKPKLNVWALLGFIFVVAGVIPIVGNLVGYIMCITALNQIQKNPGMYTGKGFAVAGFIIFTAFLVAAIVFALFYFGLVSYNGV